MFTEAAVVCARLCGIKGGIGAQTYKYYRAEVYFNTGVQQLFIERTALPSIRPAVLAHTPPDQKDAILTAPLGVFGYLKMHANMLALGYGPYKWYRVADDYLENRTDEADGRSAPELRQLDDQALIVDLEHMAELKTQFCRDCWTGFFVYARDAFYLLEVLLKRWYEGDYHGAYVDLFSGLPKRTATIEENLVLWRLSQRIRDSAVLRQAFETAGVDYLEAFEQIPEGRQFLDEYRSFASAQSHRGHADRDVFFARRGDDPSIDYGNFKTLLAADSSADPEERERQVNERRNATIAKIEARLRRQWFGILRVWSFRRLLNYAHRFFCLRDDQRHYFDRYTYAIRRIGLEFGGSPLRARYFAAS